MQFILIGLFSYWFAAHSTIPDWIKSILFNFGISKTAGDVKVPIRLKPFDCERCLAFWIALYYGWDMGIVLAVLYAGISSLIAITASILINRLR